jgi:hypothetical protein
MNEKKLQRIRLLENIMEKWNGKIMWMLKGD